MSAPRMLALAGALALASACNPFHREPAVQVSARDATLNSTWHANLASPASLAGVVQMNGSATMAPGPGGKGTTITVNLANAAPGGRHPWSARWGQCGSDTDNGVFGAVGAYQTLVVGDDGNATRTATVQLDTPTTGEFFVVVHASTANAETVVACGNFAPPTQ